MFPMKRTLIALTVLLTPAAATIGLSSTSEAVVVACPGGISYEYYQSRTGGCASANISYSGRTIYVVGSVADQASDGDCARVEVKLALEGTWDTTSTVKSACGYNTAASFSYSHTTVPAGSTGYVQSYNFRLCVGSNCSAWKSYPSAA
jgi:hypothetical protein